LIVNILYIFCIVFFIFLQNIYKMAEKLEIKGI